METPSSTEAYDHVLKLERNLLAASKSKGSFDPAVRRLRASIRDSYEALILHDLAFCEAFEVEQALWRLHYREIEGYRLRIRKLLSLQDQTRGPEATVDARKKRRKDTKKEPLLRALSSFRSFLGEASGFFHGLLIKLRLKHGLASSLGSTDRFSAEGDVTEELRRCMVTCNKILTYLGDLARYNELYAAMDSLVRDWSVAANYYKQAAVLWPSNGNPYNQLAVLCTYCGNNLTALYLYCRSIAVSVPFETAWDNMVLLLEKNKQIAAIASVPGTDVDKRFRGEITLPTNLHGFVIEQDLWSVHKVSRFQGWFIILFIELVRTLLMELSADELDRAVVALESKMEQFLYEALNDVKSSKIGSLPIALQITTVLIFCMHRVIGQPSLDDNYVLSKSLVFTLKFCTTLAKVAQGNLWSAFPVTVILLEWLATQTNVVQTFWAKEGLGKIISEFFEKVMAIFKFSSSKNMVEELDRDAQMLPQDQILGIAGKAQWEDHELLGFVPLASVHLPLDFSSQLPGYGVAKLTAYSCWRFRCVEALRKLCTAVGQDGHVFLVKILKISHTSSAIEESNLTPSLKEWIEKTFFSSDVPNDLAHTTQIKVLSNQTEAHLQDEVISTAQADPCEVVGRTGPKAGVMPIYEASTEIVMHCSQNNLQQGKDTINRLEPDQDTKDSWEQGKDIKAIKEQNVFATTAVVLVEEISSVQANVIKEVVNANDGQEVGGLGLEGPPTDVTVAGSQHQTLATAKFGSKSLDMETKFSLEIKAGDVHQDLRGGDLDLIAQLHGEQPACLLPCFDIVSNVKPQGFIEALSGLRPKSSIGLALEKKAYDTQNPFVLRLRHLLR